MMANSALPLHALAHIAVNTGLSLGFNCAGVERWLDVSTMDPRLAITWGDQALMRRPRLRTPCEWAMSYDESEPCTRQMKTVEFPESIRFESIPEIEGRFASALLELQAS